MSVSNIVTKSLSHSHLESSLFGFLKFCQQGKLSLGGFESLLAHICTYCCSYFLVSTAGRVCRHFAPQGTLAAETSLCHLCLLSEGASLTPSDQLLGIIQMQLAI